MGKILIVDNDQTVLDTNANALTNDRHTVVKCRDAMLAVKTVQIEKFDIIITELKMDKVAGDKFIEMLQGDRGALPCPVIISSKFIDDAVIEAFAGNGKIHFLPKPATIKELTTKVKEVLANPVSKGKIDVRFINPILLATMDVITQMTGFSISAGKPYVKKVAERSGDISGVVGVVSSGFKGTISLSFSERTFLAIVSKMLGEDMKAIDDENKDAVAELLNIIFGAAKKVLNENGMNIQPAIPTIIRGKDHSISHHSQNNTIVIPYTSPELGEFRTEVSSMG